MIELLWKGECTHWEGIACMSNLVAWLATALTLEKEKEKIRLQGYIVLYDDSKKSASALLFCNDDEESQKNILHILQQPPGEYKDKYIARVPCQEPEPVVEKKDDEEGSCAIEVSDDEPEWRGGNHYCR